ncbi:MAG TPA: carboxypeptidase regulatory-like domain-containing protein [Gemmatimonadaceae bacterium]|nr:carboxypeptidase regulatory-like domain-containing protein [Gemmatimonadaceae bacterium]
MPDFVGQNRPLVGLNAKCLPLAIVALVGATMPALAQPTKTRDASVAVRIVGEDSSPLAGVEVTAVATKVTRVTNPDGQVNFSPVEPGLFLLHLRRLGFQESSFLVTVPVGERVDATSSMVAVPQILPTVVQIDTGFKPMRYAKTTKFDDFYRRRNAKAGGTFITRDDIEHRQPSRSLDLFYNIAGVKLNWDAAQPQITIARCKYGNIAVFIDGLPAQNGIELVASLHPNQIEAIEIYHGLATVPPQFVPKPNDCAAIVVWTRY